MREGSFQKFMQRALELMHSEMRSGHRRLATQLADCRMQISVDDENLVLVTDEASIHIVEGFQADPSVTIRTDSKTIRVMLTEQLSWVEALRSERLFALGEPNAIAEVFETLRLFLKVAVRCPSMPEHHHNYLMEFSE